MTKKVKDIKLTVINLNEEFNSSVVTSMLFNLLREDKDRKVHLVNAYFNSSFVKEDADNMTCRIIHFNIPYLNKIKCNYCGRCITHCNRDAIALDRNVPSVTIDKHKCRGCFNCARSCTVHAITSKEIEIGQVFKTVIDNGSTILSGVHKYGANHEMHIFHAMITEVDASDTIIYEVPYISAANSRKAINLSNFVFVILPHFKTIDDEMQSLLYFIHKLNKKIVLLKMTHTENSFSVPQFFAGTDIMYFNESPSEREEDLLKHKFLRILNKI